MTVSRGKPVTAEAASPYYDAFETRSADARAADQLQALNALRARAGEAPLGDLADLAGLPVLRKSALV
ncbi:MAG: hypothetical protein R3D56_17040, partial [Paracoccaceae bacterium]